MATVQKLSNFLQMTTAQKEVCLVIAQEDKELKSFQKTLIKEGFAEAENVAELVDKIRQSVKSYFVVASDLSKEAYDLLAQYPTGQVELFNPSNMQFDIVSPNYQKLTVIFIITKENLARAERNGFNILAKAGLAYQS